MLSRFILLAGLCVLPSCSSFAEEPPLQPPMACHPPSIHPAFRRVDAFEIAFDRPLALERAAGAYFVAEQGGKIRRVTRVGSGFQATTVIDLSERLAKVADDSGLLGFALSPASEDELFVFYTGKSETSLFRSVLSRISPDGSEEILLSFDRDEIHHNGGRLVFGADRYLYVAIGDGSYGDPMRRAQDPYELFGKMLRLDVLGHHPYAIPPDNPFVHGGGRPEVFALGFRNPWSFSFDALGQLWLGDVGHERWEEIDIVTKGGNYGWPLREGRHCFQTHPCDFAHTIDPIHEYPHVDGFSVTGGLVYRGRRTPSLNGTYLFGDFMTGRIWGLDARPLESSTPRASRLLIDAGINITGFAEDFDNEPLVFDFGGRIYRIEGFSPSSEEEHVSLSSLGCLPQQASASSGLVPYDVNAPFWTDSLSKQRWFSIPRGAQIRTTDVEEWEFPAGTIFLKELASGNRRIETRMLTRNADLGWLGFTFEWNTSQTDAFLIDDAKTIDIDGAPWTLPSRAQCYACHRSQNRVLGFEGMQLNRAPRDGEENQLDAFSAAGFFDRPVPSVTASALVDPYDGSKETDARARSLLHANCSFCHRGTASVGQASMDLRAFVPVEAMNVLCRETSDLDLEVGWLVKPGEPARSAIVARTGTTGELRMPPLGSVRIDEVGVAVIADWVSSIGACR